MFCVPFRLFVHLPIKTSSSRLSSLFFSVGLFSELERQPDLGIINYGVSMTTLEDVFLRLEAEAEVDQAGECRSSSTGSERPCG